VHVDVLSIRHPRLVRTDAGSRLHMTIWTAEPRDLHGGEVDVLFHRFHLPDEAQISLRRGRLRRRRTVFRASWDAKL
jgi:hypothetical protein